jgi:D-serine deaminase-like pyridoxal phosphate-dependent protein
LSSLAIPCLPSLGITVATAQQLQIARDFGVKRIVLANQLVGRQAIRYISHPCLTFDKWQVICVVDDNYTVTSAIRMFF